MAVYERMTGGHVAERVRPEPGSDDEARYQRLADGGGWRRVETSEGAGPPVSAPSGPFDPGRHSVDEVLAHLKAADAEELLRVLDAETAGKARKGILDKRDQLIAQKAGQEQNEE